MSERVTSPFRDRVWLAHVFIPVLLLLAVLWVAWEARDALVPFAVGLVGAYAVQPLVTRLERVPLGKRRMGRTLAVAIVYVVGLLVLFIFGELVLPPLFQQAGQLIANTPKYWENLSELQQTWLGWYTNAPLPPAVRTAIEARVAELGPALLEWSQTAALSLVGTTTRFLGTALGFLIVPLWVFYVLADTDGFSNDLLHLAPRSWRATMRDLGTIADDVLGGYLRGQLLLMTTVGVAVLLGALVLGITEVAPTVGRYALLLAVIAGLTEVIPVIGPFLGAIVGVVLALIDGPIAALWTVGLYVIVQQAENSLLVPRIMGDALELRPAVIMVVLSVGAALAGPVGAILAAPLTALVREWVKYIRLRLGGPEPGNPGGLTLAASGNGTPLITDLAGPPIPPPSDNAPPAEAEARRS